MIESTCLRKQVGEVGWNIMQQPFRSFNKKKKSLDWLLNTGSVFTKHYQQHSLPFPPRYANQNVT